LDNAAYSGPDSKLGSDMTTYFVDATNGSDTNNGSSDYPWQTVQKVVDSSFNDGDSILFKRGETWTLSATLEVPRDGLTFGAYGSGADPILDGNKAIDNVVETNTKDNLKFENLYVKQGTAFGISVNASSNVTLTNIEASDCGNDNIIFTGNSQNCTATNITSHDAYENAPGPRESCLEIKDGCHDIVIDGATLYNSIDAGLAILSHDPLQGDCFPYNITIRNVSCYNNTTMGIIVGKQDDEANSDRNILIEDCVVVTGTANGIYIAETGGETIEGLTFRRVTVNTLDTANQFPLRLLGKALFENCVFAGTYPSQVDNNGDGTFSNCVFYRNASGTLQIKNSPVSTKLRNCIIYSTGQTTIDFQSITGTEDVDYNLYYNEAVDPVAGASYKWNGVAKNWADWKADTGQDANSPTPADPLFVDAANGNYIINSGSPAINTGTDVGIYYQGSAPDIGHYEFPVPIQTTYNLSNSIRSQYVDGPLAGIEIADRSGKL
jgi:hypothetical protein